MVQREGMKMKMRTTSVFLCNLLACPIYYKILKASGISQRLASRQESVASAQTDLTKQGRDAESIGIRAMA